ncbi:MAG: hypothetical protein COB38_04990 [Gammaproteobacteria bacterium]|nr:MAG: hypothetical protein COB38_04990 [Gammaproteobacteria bacterium]
MNDLKQQLQAIRSLEVLPLQESQKLDITSIKKGGFIELNNDTWQIVNYYSYLDVKWKDFSPRKKDYWVIELELYSLTKGIKTFVEWEIDDELEVCLTDASIKLRDIKYEGKSLSRKDLAYIEDEEEGEVKFAGTKYFYSDDDTWAGLFFKSAEDAKAKTNSTPLRVYEFESDDGQYLTIESWHGNEDKVEREAFVSHSIKSKDIQVLQKSGQL